MAPSGAFPKGDQVFGGDLVEHDPALEDAGRVARLRADGLLRRYRVGPFRQALRSTQGKGEVGSLSSSPAIR
ncbi:hypothetical protein AQJ64_17670 [Streptomyces griseoruber]|uniref:Uncharacterized protein n=1 Tax=Streptomyces griseoruber TaxID=1943 RepID=A0A124I3D1_9ACTN|nr:hypothetical protein AQJ64_17670 [Streptomyces griseoruber]